MTWCIRQQIVICKYKHASRDHSVYLGVLCIPCLPDSNIFLTYSLAKKENKPGLHQQFRSKLTIKDINIYLLLFSHTCD